MSNRGTVADLPSAVHLGSALPGLFQDDEFDPESGGKRPVFVQRFTSAFDELLAPIFSCLDNLDSYFDANLAPADFLEWLAGWVGVELDETWTLERRRALVLRAVELYRWRGTARGLADMVELFTGAEPEVVDNGGASWSTAPESPLPGSDESTVVVRLHGEAAADVDRARLERLVSLAKPAHLVAEIEVGA